MAVARPDGTPASDRAERVPVTLFPRLVLREHSVAVRAGFALVALAAATLARAALDPALGTTIPWATFYVAVVVVAVIADLPTALATVAVSALLGRLLFSEPRFSLRIADAAELVSLALFLSVAGLIAWVGASMGRAYRALDEQRRQLAERQQRFEAMADAAPVHIWMDDERGHGVFRNAHHRDFAGAREGAADWDALLHPEDAAGHRRAYGEARMRGADFTATVRLRRHDGVYRWFDLHGVPRFSGDRLLGYVGTSTDVTDYRATLAAVDAAKAELDVVTQNMAASVTRCSRDLRYVWVSRQYARWIARPLEDIVGRPIVDVIGAEAFAVLGRHFAAVLRGERVEYEEEVAFQHVGPRWIRGVYVPTWNTAGEVDGWIAAINDITELRRIERELRESDRRKDEFLAMLAHELRNPLAPVRNAAAVLRTLSARDPRLEQAREIIERQVTHLARLVEDLLDVSRITRGAFELRRGRLSLADVVAEAAETSRSVAEQSGHTLTVEVPERGAVPVDGDRARLTQVVGNLLMNAVKFTPPGGHITVRLDVRDGEAVIRVRDTGIGIPREARERIFDLFSQEERSLARSRGGLGIGLTLVRQIVALHGGGVEVTSEGAGRGSEFVVRLPIVRSSSRAAGAAATKASARDARSLSVLVVEDNVDAAASFAMLLELAGHEVRVAHDGYEALDAIERARARVAFVDLGLPGMDGFELARRLRQRHATDEMLLVALSGYGREEDKQNARAAGFDHHLTKPVDPDTVHALLERLVSSAPACAPSHTRAGRGGS